MNNYLIGMAVELFVGACFSFLLCALMVSAKRADKKIKDMARYKAAGKKAEQVSRRFLTFKIN